MQVSVRDLLRRQSAWSISEGKLSKMRKSGFHSLHLHNKISGSTWPGSNAQILWIFLFNTVSSYGKDIYVFVWVCIDIYEHIKIPLVVQMLQHLCDTKAICVANQWKI